MIGYKTKQTPISSYQPSQDVIDITKQARDDYQIGVEILQKPWVELNDRSVIEDTNRGQRMFNAYVDTSIEDPNESWKWRGTDSYARKKGIAMHAQLTANYLLPLFVAQNENDEIDRDFSEVMRYIIEWMAQPTNSNYQSSFLQMAFSMMYNPVTYLGAEYCEVYQKIKESTKDGKYSVKEVIDSVLSGFNASIWGPTEVLITNAYERNIQKQRVIIPRRYTEYKELEAKYGEHENWGYVKEGMKSIYSDEDGLFYDIKDEDHPHLCAEEIWKCRREDLEIPFVSGIYLGDSDVNKNPIKHRDNKGNPKYNLVPFGYNRIGDHFYFYKSMMNILGWDNMSIDAMSEIVYNRAILENEMPVAISGIDKVDSSVIFPNAVVAFENADAKVSPLLPQSNIIAGFNALSERKKSADESSVNETLSGQLPDASQKAYNVAQAQANAKKTIGAIGKSLAESMIYFGDLMKDIALNHITIPQVEELAGGRMKMKYKTFMLENKKSGNKMADQVIKFDESLIGLEMTEEEKMNRGLKLLEEVGYPKQTKSIRLVNPELFAKFTYLTKIDVEEMFTRSNEFMQPLLMALKAQLAQDPFVDQESLTRKLLYSYFNSEGEELMKENVQEIPGLPQLPQQNNQAANQILNKATSSAVNQQVI
jgi:hypothetical protein